MVKLNVILASAPFNKQTSGLPYFTGPTSLHTGAPQVQKWLVEGNDLKLLSAADAMLQWSQGAVDALECTK
eukprot:9496518-Pyramimonas_sp.AAC.1